jgi:hypothetical protein
MKRTYTISIPEYTVLTKPDYAIVGAKIDEAIQAYFTGKKAALRYLSLRDHPGLSLDDLTNIITTSGTDRYDSDRKMSVAHDFYAEKGVELFVMPVEVTNKLNISAGIIRDFYEGALQDRGYSLRIDMVVVYDLDQLEEISITYDDGRVGEGDYKFKYPERKQEAVLGIIQIL